MLDSFGGHGALREDVTAAYHQLHDIRKDLAALEAGERDRAQREDLLRYQKNEIEAAQLKPGEDEELANEQKVLANSEKLAAFPPWRMRRSIRPTVRRWRASKRPSTC